MRRIKSRQLQRMTKKTLQYNFSKPLALSKL
jgi:hypothetical protein